MVARVHREVAAGISRPPVEKTAGVPETIPFASEKASAVLFPVSGHRKLPPGSTPLPQKGLCPKAKAPSTGTGHGGGGQINAVQNASYLSASPRTSLSSLTAILPVFTLEAALRSTCSQVGQAVTKVSAPVSMASWIRDAAMSVDMA